MLLLGFLSLIVVCTSVCGYVYNAVSEELTVSGPLGLESQVDVRAVCVLKASPQLLSSYVAQVYLPMGMSPTVGWALPRQSTIKAGQSERGNFSTKVPTFQETRV